MDLNKLIHVHLGRSSLTRYIDNQVALFAYDLIPYGGLRAINKIAWNLI